jgi:hypothetical protein
MEHTDDTGKMTSEMKQAMMAFLEVDDDDKHSKNLGYHNVTQRMLS